MNPAIDCAVCDRPDAESVFHDDAMHESCAPKYWVADQKKHREFMVRFHEWWASASAWQKSWDGLRKFKGRD